MRDPADVCFVVMPFGKKPFNDGSGRTYDFDKVYRVIIQRAVKQAGLVPLRADERTGSAIIHSEMFKDLRDQAVVLADLSLENPNVFYELGIRHVMSPAGTVLICRKGSELPFDVKLSRVIFYEYDGSALDWEEVERVVQQVQLALDEARKGRPDSPVHALLESVLRGAERLGTIHVEPPKTMLAADSLEEYQQTIAQHWIESQEPAEDLGKRFRGKDVFGARCLGYYCLQHPGGMPAISEVIAKHLSDAEQYSLACRLFEGLKEEGMLSVPGLLSYATAFSEARGTLAGADGALNFVQQALAATTREHQGAPDSPCAIAAIASCHRRLAGLRHWRWQLSQLREDLDGAIEAHALTIGYIAKARALGTFNRPGHLAQSHLKLMLLLRFRDDDAERPDSERHRESIIGIEMLREDDAMSLSYLNWFQAMTLADTGSGRQAQEKALSTLASDAQIKNQPDFWEIGRRQYRTLRRFLEQNSRVWRNPSLIGTIAQLLQSGEAA